MQNYAHQLLAVAFSLAQKPIGYDIEPKNNYWFF